MYVTPFNLTQGSSIYVKVAAFNQYGSSTFSYPGNGGVMVMVPDAPLNFRDNVVVTSSSIIGLLWTDGVRNGGSSVIDYTISYD